MGLINNVITRFPNGVNNLNVGDIFNSLLMPDPTLYHLYFEDFDYFTAADWTITEVGVGGTQALTNGNGGLLLVTADVLIADSVAMQKIGSNFLLTVGKKTFFKGRMKLDLANLSRMMLGLVVTDTTPEDATDGIYFIKPSASTNVSIVVRKNATTGSTTAVAGVLANDTFVDLSWYYDGVDRLYYGFNGTIIGFLDASASFLPDIILTPTIFVGNGEAVPKVGTIDYIFAAQER